MTVCYARRVLAAVGFILLSGTGCSTGGTPTPGVNADLQGLIDDTSGYQTQVLEDGTVTFPEYERAILDTVSCIEGRGRTVSAELVPSGTYQITLAGGPEDGQLETSEAAYEECRAEFSDVVEIVYTNQAVKPDDVADRSDGMEECIRVAGQDLPEAPTDQQIRDASLALVGNATFEECLVEVLRSE